MLLNIIREFYCIQLMSSAKTPHAKTLHDQLPSALRLLSVTQTGQRYRSIGPISPLIQMALPNLRRLFVEARTEAEENEYSRNAVRGESSTPPCIDTSACLLPLRVLDFL